MSVRDQPAVQRRPFLAPAVAHNIPRVEDRAGPPIGLQVLLFVLAAALSGFTILRGISPHDEGLMLQAGSRIAAGQWPYRDFWTNYMPGQPLLLALLHQIFGPSLLAWRVVRTLTDATVTLLAYRLARRRAPESYALAAWLAVTGAMAFPTGPGPNPPALALAFGALLAAKRRPALGAVLAGVACLFRLEIGVAAIIGVALEAPIGAARATAIGAGCGLVVLAPFFAVAPGAMWHDTLGFYGIQDLQRLQRFRSGSTAATAEAGSDRVLHPPDPADRSGPVGARGGAAERAATGGLCACCVRRRDHDDGTAVQPDRSDGIAVARPARARWTRLPRRPHRRLSPDPACGGAAGDARASCRGRTGRSASNRAAVCAGPDRAARPGPPRRPAPASAVTRHRARSGRRRGADGQGRRSLPCARWRAPSRR